MVIIATAQPYPNHSTFDSYFEWFSNFSLSDFQKHAIQAIVEGNHILITAHTGSGKTLPAEFAIKYFCGGGGGAAQPRKRVVYTSPIKALSNQKFYELTRKFPDITFGIITGDIKCNPDADVLIMTTEILLNNLMGVGSTDINLVDLAAVIFDEVHYINDPDRGKTWEQTILMLPPHIQLVMLSATIDAPEKFAQWVEGRGGGARRVVLCSTNMRVVPLTHYGYMITNEGFYKNCTAGDAVKQEVRAATNEFIVLRSGEGAFSEAGYLKLHRLNDLLEDVRVSRTHVMNRLVEKVRNNDMLPAIVFCFSRKKVEKMAEEITVNLFLDPADLTGPQKENGAEVPRVCEQILRGKLANYREYLQLPEYVRLVGLLEKGIAFHHSGMLPVLREIVEFMISQKYVKLLFATESFAIGLDCPIRTAIFSSFTKFDGKGERFLLPHEYNQMAGRAGRRGMDTVGHVIHCNNLFDLPTQLEYNTILCGAPQKLVSKFYINYQLMLRLYDATATGAAAAAPEFIKNSMISTELNKEIERARQNLAQLTALATAAAETWHNKTPREICEEYLFCETIAKSSVNKKRRDMERKCAALRDLHPSIVSDVKTVISQKDLQDKIADETARVDFLEHFFENKIQMITDILTNYNLYGDGELTALGKFAARVGEIHPVIIVYLLEEKWNWFADTTVEEIVAILSCLTDIAPAEEFEVIAAPTTAAAQLKEIHDTFYDIEINLGLNTGFSYQDAVQFHIMDAAREWASGCETETECKYFIQERILARGISVGDFVKAMLKISNIARELGAMVGETHVEFAHKLSQVDARILKYIVNMQSLYV